MTTRTQPPIPATTRPAATSGGVPAWVAVPAMIAVVLVCIAVLFTNEPQTFELAPQAATTIGGPAGSGVVTARSI